MDSLTTRSISLLRGDFREARSGQLIRADAYPRDLTEFPVRFAADPALGTFPDVALAGAFSASPSLDE